MGFVSTKSLGDTVYLLRVHSLWVEGGLMPLTDARF